MRVLILAVCLLWSHTAFAWDPWGDIQNPGRILNNAGREINNGINDIPNIPANIQREAENVGREIDRMRIEFNAVTNAPLLASWLQASRDSANPGSAPIPPNIRAELGQFYDEDIYNRVTFKVGDGGALNLANLSIQYGDARAVTLIDTVIFADAAAANDTVLWAHELWHIKQYRDWGVMDFAIHYLRSYNSVENEAYDAEARFRNSGGGNAPLPGPRGVNPIQPTPMPMPVPQVALSAICRVGPAPVDACMMNNGMFPIGSQCMCQTPFGPRMGAVNPN